MFESLTKNLTKIFDRIKSSGALTEKQIEEAMRDVRIALLEADVALPVVKDFINSVKEKALGTEIIKSISPAQMVIKIIHEEIITILSSENSEQLLNLKTTPPANILMVGLQGSGKTTASAKLALRLKKQNKKVLLVSLDTYRPAAQEQLEILAKSVQIESLSIISDQKPLEITMRAISAAQLSGVDVVIYDTAGRLHIDDAMMTELTELKKMIQPIETLLVVDSMMGQDSVNVAKHFNEKLDITGVILSRIDGDARGGAALSIKYVTNKPIKFLSSGEKLDSIEEFDPERIASRILDKGDIISLVEKAANLFSKEESELAAKKLQKGKFDLGDYLTHIKNIKKFGGIGEMVKMLPGMGNMMDKVDKSKLDNRIFERQEAIILSMTTKERRDPKLLNSSRRKRIAAGSGTSVQQVNILLKQFEQISEMMKKASRMNPRNLMNMFKGRG